MRAKEGRNWLFVELDRYSINLSVSDNSARFKIELAERKVERPISCLRRVQNSFHPKKNHISKAQLKLGNDLTVNFGFFSLLQFGVPFAVCSSPPSLSDRTQKRSF